MNKQERYSYISTNLNSKNGIELGNLIYHIKLLDKDLNPYNEILIEKLNNAVFPYDIFILSKLLVENEDNKLMVEKVLNSKILIWDTGSWSEKFWDLIKSNNLDIEKPKYYDFEDRS